MYLEKSKQQEKVVEPIVSDYFRAGFTKKEILALSCKIMTLLP